MTLLAIIKDQTRSDLSGAIWQANLHYFCRRHLGRMNIEHLRACVEEDKGAGWSPFLVVASAGSTALGVVDPLEEIAGVSKDEGLWMHVDGAYGGCAVVSPEAPRDLRGLRHADSVTIDPHKWLYMPADVGCVLVRHRGLLFDAFRQSAAYYADDDPEALYGGPESLQFRDLDPQVSRSFRALKVRLGIQFAGYEGYRK